MASSANLGRLGQPLKPHEFAIRDATKGNTLELELLKYQGCGTFIALLSDCCGVKVSETNDFILIFAL